MGDREEDFSQALILWKLLKFEKCPYWCLITALYSSPGKIIRCVLLCYLGDPSATSPTLTIASVVFRGVSVVLTRGPNFLQTWDTHHLK
jgi:hypothetical protein